MQFVGLVIDLVLRLFLLLLFARFVVDWVQVFARSWTPKGVVLVLLETVYSITDPPVKALRRVIPPLRLGGMAIDLSFIVLLVLCYVLLGVNSAIFLR